MSKKFPESFFRLTVLPLCLHCSTQCTVLHSALAHFRALSWNGHLPSPLSFCQTLPPQIHKWPLWAAVSLPRCPNASLGNLLTCLIGLSGKLPKWNRALPVCLLLMLTCSQLSRGKNPWVDSSRELTQKIVDKLRTTKSFLQHRQTNILSRINFWGLAERELDITITHEV